MLSAQIPAVLPPGWPWAVSQACGGAAGCPLLRENPKHPPCVQNNATLEAGE
jgi:hypothetical protein